MNPKSFWALNHLTVPVVIFFSKAHKRVPRDNHAVNFNFVDVFGKGARRRIQQGTAANRMASMYATFTILQGRKAILFQPGSSGAPIESLQVTLSTCKQDLSAGAFWMRLECGRARRGSRCGKSKPNFMNTCAL